MEASAIAGGRYAEASADKCKLPIVLRLGEEVLDFLFAEGDSWKRFYLRGFDRFLQGSDMEPGVLDAELEECSEPFKSIFGRRSELQAYEVF